MMESVDMKWRQIQIISVFEGVVNLHRFGDFYYLKCFLNFNCKNINLERWGSRNSILDC
jgi:hypothetical protein